MMCIRHSLAREDSLKLYCGESQWPRGSVLDLKQLGDHGFTIAVLASFFHKKNIIKRLQS